VTDCETLPSQVSDGLAWRLLVPGGLGHSHSSWFRRHPAQSGLDSSHFFFRRRQVRHPVLTRGKYVRSFSDLFSRGVGLVWGSGETSGLNEEARREAGEGATRVEIEMVWSTVSATITDHVQVAQTSCQSQNVHMGCV